MSEEFRLLMCRIDKVERQIQRLTKRFENFAKNMKVIREDESKTPCLEK